MVTRLRIHRTCCTGALALAMGAAFVPSGHAQALVDGGSTVVLGRYSTAPAEPPPELARPLEVVASLSFPRQTVRSIGEAVQHLLTRSGYRLAVPPDEGGAVARFLALPLPESQRQLGPYRVRSLLGILLGSAWAWQGDPMTREIRIHPGNVTAAVAERDADREAAALVPPALQAPERSPTPVTFDVPLPTAAPR
jgi:conjugative transfer region protein (TIGR03748 family)